MKINYKNYLTLAGAAGLAQGFALLISPVVTRIYSPESFGGFGLLLACSVVIGAVGTGRLEHAIPVAMSHVQGIRVFALGALSITTVAALCAAVLVSLVCSGALTDTLWAGLPLLAVPLMAAALGLFQLTNAMLLRQKFYNSVSANKILQGFCTGSLQIVLGLLSSGPLGLVLAQAIGYLSGCLAGLRRLIQRLTVMHARQGFAVQDTFRRFRSFPFVLAPAALFNQLSQHVPVLAIGYIYGLHEAGMYALVLRVCSAPSSLIGQAVGQVYAGDIREVLHRSNGNIAKHYSTLLTRMFAIGIPVVCGMVLVMMLGDEILFGHQWTGLGEVTFCLLAKLLVDFASAPVAMTLGYLEKQRLQLYWDVGRLSAVILVFVFVSQADLAFLHTLILLSFVWAAGQLVHVYVTYRACQAHWQHQNTVVTLAR